LFLKRENTVTTELEGVARPDYLKVCQKAVRTFQRQGICEWVEREELISEGCLALAIRAPGTEAMAFKIARDAMIDAIRKSGRRNRGRVEVRSALGADADVSEGDQWDETIHGKQHLQPISTHPDLWDAMKELPERQYRAVTLTYWADMTDAEVAAEMGITHQAVHLLLTKAKINIREGVAIGDSHTVTNMRGNVAPRAVLSGGTEEA
jgi:RNA polymerase sigma factor (sigma-70 family)